MTSESPLSVKVRHSEEFRRFTIETFPLTFAMLAKLVRTIFALQPTVPIVLRYQDNEGDLITLSTDMEVAEALRFLGSSNRVLRLQLTLPPAPSAAKAAATPKAPAAKPPAAKPAAAPAGADAATAKPAAAPTATAPTAVAALPVTPGSTSAPAPAPSAAAAASEGVNKAEVAGGKAEKLAERQRRLAAEREQLLLHKAQEKAVRDAARAEEIKRREEEKKEALRKKMQQANETGTTDAPAVHVQLLKAEVQRLKAELKLAKAEKDGVAPGKALLWARFVRDVSVPDGSVLQPNETFVKTWRFRNELEKPWPAGTRLLFVGKNSDRLGAPDEVLISECLQPGQELDVSVPLVAPAAPGRYTAYFRLATPEGKKFGQRVWVIISVGSNGNNSSGEDENDPAATAPTAEALAPYAAQLAILAELRFTNDAINLRLLRKFNGSLEHVIEKLMRRRAKVQKMRAAVAAASAAPAPAAPVAIPIPPANSAAVAPAIPSAAIPLATMETPKGDAVALPLAPAPVPAPRP